ncbi:MAG: acyl-ACP--UDP-N-acetylglucosamine O-acyltransferase [Gemmatimonadota bacterium]
MNPTEIHPTALVDDDAELGTGVRVGPHAIIGPRIEIGDRTVIGPDVLIEKDTTVGAECVLYKGAVLGTDPQDLKYDEERTVLRVGDRTTIREYATLNRGTEWSRETVVGSDCLLMAYTHVAHDCRIGDHVILSNAVNMAGHVTIEDWAIVGGIVPIHQFVRVGTHAFVGGGSRISQDVPPYCRVAGSPAKLYGLNSVGLERRDFSEEVRRALKQAYRTIFSSEHTVSRGLDKLESDDISFPEVQRLVDFVRSSERGVTT